MLCNDEGGVVDDLIVYRWSTTGAHHPQRGQRGDRRARCAGGPEGIVLDDQHRHGIIAVQGPRSRERAGRPRLPADD